MLCFCLWYHYRYKAVNRNMESKVEYTETPPSYTPPAPTQYQATYPPPGPQQYPLTSQNPSPSAQQYPQATGPYGQHYGYDQPPAGYPPQQGYGNPRYTPSAPQQQQQQQQVVVVGAGQQQLPIIVHHVPSYVGHIIFSCIVFWVCNPLFGAIAFILSGQYKFVVIWFTVNS